MSRRDSRPFVILELLTRRDRSSLEGKYVTLMRDAKNDFHTKQLPVIPAGTVLRLDFGGDFGLYAFADIGGVLQRVKINLDEVHKINWRGLIDYFSY